LKIEIAAGCGTSIYTVQRIAKLLEFTKAARLGSIVRTEN